MTLTKREVSSLIRLLGVLQTHLESCIESSVLADGSLQPGDEIAAANVPMDRRDWRLAEGFVKKLDAARSRGRSRQKELRT